MTRKLIRSGKPVLTQTTFPDDVDTTSLALTILGGPRDVVDAVMDKMLGLRLPDGIMQVSDPYIPVEFEHN